MFLEEAVGRNYGCVNKMKDERKRPRRLNIKKTKIEINIPIGAFVSIALFLCMIIDNIWSKLSMPLKWLAIIGLIVLWLFGSVDYEREETKEKE